MAGRSALLPLAAVVGMSVAGCGSILGFDDFTAPEAASASSASSAGSAGSGGSGGHAGGSGGGAGGAGGTGSRYHCVKQGVPATLISEMDVPGAKWSDKSFFVVSRKEQPDYVHVIALDEASGMLYMRSASDPSSPGDLVSWDANAVILNSGTFRQAEATDTLLTLYSAGGNGIGKLTTPVAGGPVVSGMSTFVPFSPQPPECAPAPAHGVEVSVVADSWAFRCESDATFSLFLDGVLVESGADNLKVHAHHLIAGTHVLFTGKDDTPLWRLGKNAGDLLMSHPLSLSSAPDHLQFIGSPILGADADDMLLFGSEAAPDLSSLSVLTGRVPPDGVALAMVPPTGISEAISVTGPENFATWTQASYGGSIVATGGVTGDKKAVALNLFDKDGKLLVWDFHVTETTGSFEVAGAAHGDSAATFFVAWVEAPVIKAQNVLCTPSS